MFETRIDFEFVAAVKAIARELEKANNLKVIELRWKTEHDSYVNNEIKKVIGE